MRATDTPLATNPLLLTLCCLPFKKLKYQFPVWGLSGSCLSFCDKSSCFTQSKALLKSIENKRTALHSGVSRNLLTLLKKVRSHPF